MTAIRHVEVVDDEEMMDGGESDQQEEDIVQASSVNSLSKSWSVAAAHVPTFSGGKVTHCHRKGLVGFGDDEEEDNPTPFLILPVGGDLALVDAKKGVKIRTIRQGSDALVEVGNDEEDEDAGVDGDAILSYALSWNDQLLLTCSRNQLIRQYSLVSPWPTSQAAPVSRLWGKSGHNLPITHMQFHLSDVFVATGSVDGSVRVWDVRGGYATHVFRPSSSGGGDAAGGTRAVTALAWKRETSALILAIGRANGSISIHNLREANQNLAVVLRDHVSAVTCVDWSSTIDGIMVSTGRDAVMNMWRLTTTQSTGSKKKKKKKKRRSDEGLSQTYERIHTKPVYERVEGMIMLPSNDGEMSIATAGSKGVVRVWKTTRQGNEKGVSGFELLAEQPKEQGFGEEKGGYLSLDYNPRSEGESFSGQLVVADAEHNVKFLSPPSNDANVLETLRTFVGHNDEILDMKIVPPKSNAESTDLQTMKVVVATNSAQVRLFELGTFSCEILDGHTATVLCIDVSPCGRYIATSGKDKTMRVWESDSRRCLAVATGHTEAIGACGFSRKVGKFEVGGKAASNGGGAFAVTASKDRTLKRWNLPGPNELADTTEPLELTAMISARVHEKDINIVTVAPNDSIIASGSQDKTVKLWRSTDLSLQGTLKGHKRGVWDCQFSPHDRVIATASGDRTVKLWSLADCSCVRTFQGHVASALRVRFLSGGLQLVSSGADGLLKLWTIRTNECETTMDGHFDKVWSLDVAPNGKHLISGGADSQIVVWKDTTVQEERSRRAEEERNILKEQQLANHLRHKEFEQALEIALDLEKPNQALKVVASLIENDVQNGKRDGGLGTLQSHIRTWSIEKVAQVLRYCRDWNTRALNSGVAMLLVKAVVTTVPIYDLATKANEIPTILAGITPYAERHYNRLDRLCTSSYLLDFTLSSMGVMELDDDDNAHGSNFASWESKSKLVLPPKYIDGRTQVGGRPMVGRAGYDSDDDDSEAGIVSMGDSDSSEDEAEPMETAKDESASQDREKQNEETASDSSDDDASDSDDDDSSSSVQDSSASDSDSSDS